MTESSNKRAAIRIGGVDVQPGERRSVRIPVARSYTQAELYLPVHIIHGRRSAPSLFVSAAIHGDEINGVEIIRRLLKLPALSRLEGTLIAVPIVNVYGFVVHQRTLPDRRDLNRSFPGSATGSMAARLAHQFMREIVSNATHGIDLHTGAIHRTNLPQIRACLDDPETEQLARAFGVPVLVNANTRDGSLRQAVLERRIPMLVFEGGEALRFDELAIRAGVAGIVAVMRRLGMLPPTRKKQAREARPFLARSSAWVRAPESGILTTAVNLGDHVDEGQQLGTVSDPLGGGQVDIPARSSGIVIGRVTIPLVNEGDALFHVARFEKPESVAARVEAFGEDLSAGR